MKPIIVVQGGQWGSEAKGAIAAYLCKTEGVDIAVRTGTVNAGHTVYYKGTPFKMQQLPTSWATRPAMPMVLGPGAFIHLPTLKREMREITEALGHPISVMVDYRVGVHLDGHTDTAKRANRHHLIGTTGKGCSEAVLDRVRNRGVAPGTLADALGNDTFLRTMDAMRVKVGDTVAYLNYAIDQGAKVLVEGTQGSHLDLLLGPYPHVTHKPTNAGQWLVEAGLSPSLPVEVVLVCRTYPIRVAGNSGPMQGEMSWVELAREINQKLEEQGVDPLVSPTALDRFNEVLGEAPFEHPPHSSLTRQHEWWEGVDREKYRVTLSEANKWAMENVEPEIREELGKLFEMTTVTRKLRRVARWNNRDVLDAMTWNRPDRIALTFLNYWDPQVWRMKEDERGRPWAFSAPGIMVPEIARKVRWVSTGPETKHIHRVGKVVSEGNDEVLWEQGTYDRIREHQ